MALSSDGKYLIGSYPTLGGSGNAYVFDVGEIIKTVENPGGKNLATLAIDKANPKIASNIFATGGNPLGLIAASPKPPSKKLSQPQRNALTKVIQDLLKFFQPLGEFVAGAVYQWLHDNGDLGRWLLQVLIPGWNGVEKDVEKGLPQSLPFQLGRTFGDGTALVTGILEIIGGGGAAGGGGSLCITGIGCIAGAPALAAGVALQVHGASVASAALANIGKLFGGRQIVFHSSAGDSTDNTGGRPYEKPTSIRDQYPSTVVSWRASPNQRAPIVIFEQLDSRPGFINVTDIFKFDFPGRSGGKMIVDALDMAGVLRRGKPTTIRLSGIIEVETVEQLKKGVPIEHTKLGNVLKNAINELGGRPTSWNKGYIRDNPWIEVTISY